MPSLSDRMGKYLLGGGRMKCKECDIEASIKYIMKDGYCMLCFDCSAIVSRHGDDGTVIIE